MNARCSFPQIHFVNCVFVDIGGYFSVLTFSMYDDICKFVKGDHSLKYWEIAFFFEGATSFFLILIKCSIQFQYSKDRSYKQD